MEFLEKLGLPNKQERRKRHIQKLAREAIEGVNDSKFDFRSTYLMSRKERDVRAAGVLQALGKTGVEAHIYREIHLNSDISGETYYGSYRLHVDARQGTPTDTAYRGLPQDSKTKTLISTTDILRRD